MPSSPTPPLVNSFVQIAYTVPDARKAARKWADHFGAGPFFVVPNIPLKNVVIRGAASQFHHTSAYGWHGEIMVELVQQNCTTPSIFNNRPFGLHHMATFADHLDQQLQRFSRSGLNVAMSAETGNGMQFAFVDAVEECGHYIEVYQDNPGLRDFYQRVESAARGWDGRQPVRDPSTL